MVLWEKMLTVLANSKQTEIQSRQKFQAGSYAHVSHHESRTCCELPSGEGINQEGFGVIFITT